METRIHQQAADVAESSMMLIEDSTAQALAPTPLTEIEAAARLGLKVATLRAWRHQGKGPAFVCLGRAIRYVRSDIDQFLAANRHRPRAVENI
jgi:excisionase family DNA binding protein